MEFRFDPETGEMVEVPDSVQVSPGGYGQEPSGGMMGAAGGYQGDLGGGFDAMDTSSYGPVTPIAPPKKSKLPLVIAIVLAAVVLIGGVAAYAFPYLTVGENYKYVKAFQKTFSAGEMSKKLGYLAKQMQNGDRTGMLSAKVKDVEFQVESALSTKKKEMYSEGSVIIDGFKMEAKMKADTEKLVMNIPQVSTRTLQYTPGGSKSGLLADIMKEADVSFSDIDALYKQSLEGKTRDDSIEIMEKANLKAIQTFHFEKSRPRDVEIDGKMRSCKGYKAHLGIDEINTLCNIYETAMIDYMRTTKNVGKQTMRFDELTESFRMIRENASEVESDLILYLYKGRVAAVGVEYANGGLMLMEFRGGKIPWGNTVLTINGTELFKILRTESGSDETIVMTVMEAGEIFRYRYNSQTGDFSLNTDAYDTLRKLEIEGNFEITKTSCSIKLTKLRYDDKDIVAFARYSLKKGAVIKDVDIKSPFDLGNASISDWRSLIANLDKAALNKLIR